MSNISRQGTDYLAKYLQDAKISRMVHLQDAPYLQSDGAIKYQEVLGVFKDSAKIVDSMMVDGYYVAIDQDGVLYSTSKNILDVVDKIHQYGNQKTQIDPRGVYLSVGSESCRVHPKMIMALTEIGREVDFDSPWARDNVESIFSKYEVNSNQASEIMKMLDRNRTSLEAICRDGINVGLKFHGEPQCKIYGATVFEIDNSGNLYIAGRNWSQSMFVAESEKTFFEIGEKHERTDCTIGEIGFKEKDNRETGFSFEER